MRKTKEELARRIYDLSQRIKGDQDEMAELREMLTAKMKPGQAVPFDTPEGPFRAKLCEGSETILKDNKAILAVIEQDFFVKAAKIGCGALKETLSGLPKEMAASMLAECTKATVAKTTLKILKGGI